MRYNTVLFIKEQKADNRNNNISFISIYIEANRTLFEEHIF